MLLIPLKSGRPGTVLVLAWNSSLKRLTNQSATSVRRHISRSVIGWSWRGDGEQFLELRELSNVKIRISKIRIFKIRGPYIFGIYLLTHEFFFVDFRFGFLIYQLLAALWISSCCLADWPAIRWQAPFYTEPWSEQNATAFAHDYQAQTGAT